MNTSGPSRGRASWLKRLLLPLITVAVLAASASPAAASITRSGNTFTASPAISNSQMVYGGYTFIGIPPNPTVVRLFGLPADSVTVSDLIDTLQADPDFGRVIQEVQTSVSVSTTVSGDVEDDPPAEEEAAERSSWG